MNAKTSAIAGLMMAAAIFGFGGALSLNAAAPAGIKRTLLFKQDSSIPGREGLVASVELAPGAAEGRHTHPADVYGYVLEGSATIEKAGSPTLTLRAGEVFYIPAGVVHQGINNGKVTAKVVAVFVAEKGRPLTTPVAEIIGQKKPQAFNSGLRSGLQ
jgi:quercetin dioxygenase-like cupin family protein